MPMGHLHSGDFNAMVKIKNILALWLLITWCSWIRAAVATELITHSYVSSCLWVNSLAPGRFQINFRQVISKLTLVNGGWGISYGISLRWMPLDLTDDKSTLVQVMAWCFICQSIPSIARLGPRTCKFHWHCQYCKLSHPLPQEYTCVHAEMPYWWINTKS